MNPQRYGKLLAKVLPVRIETEEENDRMLAETEKLIEKGDRRTPEEDALLDLLAHLVQQFERDFYHLGGATPHEILRELMAARGLKQSDLLHIFRSKGIASEVVNGKRGISKAQAKALADFFHVSAELFI
ncbi:MAG: transcriptional regulator [Acidobacteria bacterium]|nr:MAG: transcriptional regulator [Acidobacteriota bacterium]PYS84646.1 MAG: transcriptional regulator [Acidobacteriota bacterium]